MTLYNVGFDPAAPTQVVWASALKPGGRLVAEQTISNRDPGIPLLIATDLARQVPDFTGPRVSIVDPLSSTVVNGTTDVWALGNPAGGFVPGGAGIPGVQQSILVDVVDTALGTSGNPVAIATALVTSGLALQIAQQIASTGIPVIPDPTIIYNL